MRSLVEKWRADAATLEEHGATAGLQKRGDLTVWLSDAALDAWRAPASGKPGGQRTYADIAIEAALTIGMVFHLPLRQSEGFLRLLGFASSARSSSAGSPRIDRSTC